MCKAREGLHSINDQLREVLARWAKEPSDPSAIQSDVLTRLATGLSGAAELLNSVAPSGLPDLQMEKEIAEYRGNVEKLHGLLPAIHSRLLGEKARLEGARAHLGAAAAWAAARKKIL